jgi:hypothetical protein
VPLTEEEKKANKVTK